MFDTYLRFVAERHRIWEQRQTGDGSFSTTDPILRDHKFTNVFRVLDWGSQFVLRELMQDPTVTDADRFMRSFLYRYTNRPEPWEWFLQENGHYPTFADYDSGLLLASWRRYDEAGGVFFSSAYTMFCGKVAPGTRRFEWAVSLVGNLPRDGEFYDTPGTQARVDLLRQLPRTGFFMAQQVVTDYGWCDPRATEDDWVAPGPGSLRGVAALGGGKEDFPTVVALCQDALHELHPEVSLELPGDGGHWAPTLMDVQNTLCEFGKYARRMEKPTSHKHYQPAHPGRMKQPVFPAHWEGQPR